MSKLLSKKSHHLNPYSYLTYIDYFRLHDQEAQNYLKFRLNPPYPSGKIKLKLQDIIESLDDFDLSGLEFEDE